MYIEDRAGGGGGEGGLSLPVDGNVPGPDTDIRLIHSQKLTDFKFLFCRLGRQYNLQQNNVMALVLYPVRKCITFQRL